MQKSFTTIKGNLQLDMPIYSYSFPIPTLLLSYESKKPLGALSFAEFEKNGNRHIVEIDCHDT